MKNTFMSLFVIISLFLLPVLTCAESCSSAGLKQYESYESCKTRERMCCQSGLEWSEWGKDCPCKESYGSWIESKDGASSSDTCSGNTIDSYTCASEAKTCIDVTKRDKQNNRVLGGLNYSEAVSYPRDNCDADAWKEYSCKSGESRDCYDVYSKSNGIYTPGGTKSLSCSNGRVSTSSLPYGYCYDSSISGGITDSFINNILNNPSSFCSSKGSYSCWIPTSLNCPSSYGSQNIPVVNLSCGGSYSAPFEYRTVTCISKAYRSVTCCAKT